MMNDSKKNKSKQLTDDTKLRHAIDFVEELSWLLESKNKLKLSEIPDILRKASDEKKSLSMLNNGNGTDKYISPNPNIHYLIGVLPRLFKDSKIFPKNEDIVEFANEVLEIEVSRSDKRSRYELIGLIVCECNDLDDSKLDLLVSALSNITGSSDKINLMVTEKKNIGFSWNETIRKLAK
ncbi:hypothetical protein [Vibrio injensis]|uniref:hypothetical protein n=1 Tax=Vibrio injensis TaxID=1307414 RepID=UPI00278BC2DC|nr:hypothetical protein [Vibrio injensis]